MSTFTIPSEIADFGSCDLRKLKADIETCTEIIVPDSVTMIYDDGFMDLNCCTALTLPTHFGVFRNYIYSTLGEYFRLVQLPENIKTVNGKEVDREAYALEIPPGITRNR